MAFSRRMLMQRALYAAAVAALPTGATRRVLAAPLFQTDPFRLGVASGDPVADGFVIWTRIAPDPLDPDALPPDAFPVAWEVANDPQMRKIVARGTQTARPDMAHSVHVDVTGLAPMREYFYRFHCGEATSRVGRALTLPTPLAPVDRVRFAYASCSHLEQGYFCAYRDMPAQDPAFILHLGDYVYESSWGVPVRHHPGPEPKTLADYRVYHAAYKMDRDLQEAHAYCPWFVMWDDHELVNDYARDGAEGTPDPKAFYERKVAAYRAYYEHMPIRPYARAVDGEMRLYQRAWYGNLMELSIPDLRQFRDPIACKTPERRGGRVVDTATCPELALAERSMLGPAQEFWFRNGFARANCRWNVLASSLMFAHFDQMNGPSQGVFTDSWGGYPAARRKIIDLVKQRGITNMVSLAGDIHSYFVSAVKDNEADPGSATIMSEFTGTSVTSESFNTALFNSLLPENPHIAYCNDTVRGYGLCDVTPDTWRTTFKAVENVRLRDSAVRTLNAWVVENGRPGPVAA